MLMYVLYINIQMNGSIHLQMGTLFSLNFWCMYITYTYSMGRLFSLAPMLY